MALDIIPALVYNKNSGFYAERSDNVDEKKRAKIIKVCKIAALIMAVIMILGVLFQYWVY